MSTGGLDSGGWREPLRRFGPALVIVAAQLVLFPVPAGVFLRGVIVGLLSALAAPGRALIYRANRIINFAQTDLGSVPTALGVYLIALCVLALGEEWLWDAFVWHEHDALLATPALSLEQAAPLLVPLLSVPQLTHYLLDGFLWRLDGHNSAFADWLASRPAGV